MDQLSPFTFGTRLPGDIALVAAMGPIDEPAVQEVAEDAAARLRRALATLEARA